MSTQFSELGLPESILAELDRLGYEEPTPIQAEAIPAVIAGSDVLGQAATGTGKTAAFALPILANLPEGSKPGPPHALILTPTRELAMQVSEAVHAYGRGSGARVVPIYGGQPISRQLRALKQGVDVVVATPGRALDHINRGTLKLDFVSIVVLDEADEMLDMGFADDLEAILDETPPDRQTVLFSATLPPRINSIAKRHLRNPTHIQVARETPDFGEDALISQRAYVVHRSHKPAALGRILDVESPEAAIVFCRTRNEVDELADVMNGRGYRAEALHGGISQEQRDKAMGRLKSGTADLLIATDVAARGLDIDHLSHVINYNVPAAAEAYVHRIGRTGRAGRSGTAITLVEPREHRLLKNVERLTKQEVTIEKVPTIADMRAARAEMIRTSVRETIMAEESESFRGTVESLSDEFDLMEIAMAALKLANDAEAGDDADTREIPDADLKASGKGKGKKKKFERYDKSKRSGSAGMTRLYVSLGRNQGVRPKDLVGAITGEAGIGGRQIGSIEISGKFSLVEVPEDKVDEVIGAMKHAKIRGKRVTFRRERF